MLFQAWLLTGVHQWHPRSLKYNPLCAYTGKVSSLRADLVPLIEEFYGLSPLTVSRVYSGRDVSLC